MSMRLVPVILAIVVASLPDRPAAACGGGTVSTSAPPLAGAQRIFLSVRGGKTEVVVQVGVQASPGDYGALIPLPSQPTVDALPISSAELDELDSATRVLISELA